MTAPFEKSPFGFSLWVIICVSIGFYLAYLEGVSTKAIVTAAIIISAGVTILFLGALIFKASRK
ncbi:MAG: hypothetical protein O7F71_16590 [Gammaproteobacteria bacterium]|nr:hypothetical protein [Gammaproteobacteria bacterium]